MSDSTSKLILNEILELRKIQDSLYSDLSLLQNALYSSLEEIQKLKRDLVVVRREAAFQMRKRAAEVVKHLSHEDGFGSGSHRIESAILSLSLPEESISS